MIKAVFHFFFLVKCIHSEQMALKFRNKKNHIVFFTSFMENKRRKMRELDSRPMKIFFAFHNIISEMVWTRGKRWKQN